MQNCLGSWLKGKGNNEMRMWMCNPIILCNKHLLGEHVEHHMFVGSINNKISMNGYIDNNLLEILSLFNRHDALVHELLRRHYIHRSPLLDFTYDHLEQRIVEYNIDRRKSLDALTTRCERCYNNAMKVYNANIDMLDAFYKESKTIEEWSVF